MGSGGHPHTPARRCALDSPRGALDPPGVGVRKGVIEEVLWISRPDAVTPLSPTYFFSALLAEIDDLAELKVTLAPLPGALREAGLPPHGAAERVGRPTGPYSCCAAGPQREAPPRRGFSPDWKRPAQRGTLLEVRLLAGEAEDRCYLLNTALNRELVAAAGEGRAEPGRGTAFRRPDGWPCRSTRPSIYDLYEQNIGLLTPLIAEELQQAEESYPAEWIEDAFREAVSYNRRNWRYVRRILENWAANGRGEDGKGRRHPKGSGTPSTYLGGQVRPPPQADSEEPPEEPACPICKGAGFLRLDVAPGHPDFGKLVPCRCRSQHHEPGADATRWSG